MIIQNRKTWVGIFALVAIEQIIKIIINSNFFESRISILPSILYFEPIFNRNYSWVNSMFQLGVGKWVHIIFNLVLIVLAYLFFRYLNNQVGTNRIIKAMFAFLFAGATCSLIDKIFWDGSLDYILVKGFFTFDLKDVYLNVFNGLLILTVIIENKAFRQLDEKKILMDFVRYTFRKS